MIKNSFQTETLKMKYFLYRQAVSLLNHQRVVGSITSYFIYLYVQVFAGNLSAGPSDSTDVTRLKLTEVMTGER